MVQIILLEDDLVTLTLSVTAILNSTSTDLTFCSNADLGFNLWIFM